MSLWDCTIFFYMQFLFSFRLVLSYTLRNHKTALPKTTLCLLACCVGLHTTPRLWAIIKKLATWCLTIYLVIIQLRVGLLMNNALLTCNIKIRRVMTTMRIMWETVTTAMYVMMMIIIIMTKKIFNNDDECCVPGPTATIMLCYGVRW